MKRLFSQPHWFQIVLCITVALLTSRCQNCQDLKSSDASAYIKVLFFLDSTQSSATTVNFTKITSTNGTSTDTITGNFINFLLPSDNNSASYSVAGTYTDTSSVEKTFSEDFQVKFSRKIGIEKPDCGVTETITINEFTSSSGTSRVRLINVSPDTTSGNIQIFLEHK
ncbi:hypothetical protein [uncultured Microscilla sp.]|uniref:hypothetical protein n=1 Tax=uncultured Microscilla sp. TaxID=432653 RepID=UPI0026331C25|nr:hypothetical protein [uncultured Microscilla sp.]